jgi:Rieske Fe-S protein
MRDIQDSPLTSRRALLAGAGVTCAAVLAGCSSSDPSSSGTTPAATGTTAAAAGRATATGGSPATAVAAGALAATSQVPEGGGLIIDGKNIVITQPQSGAFRAFSAICTHQGCIVNRISNGTIDCPCHGSKYSIKDGSVVNGPAPRPLTAVAIKVEGTSIFEG